MSPQYTQAPRKHRVGDGIRVRSVASSFTGLPPHTPGFTGFLESTGLTNPAERSMWKETVEISKIHWNEYPTFSGISLGNVLLSTAAQYTKRDIGVHITIKFVIMAERAVWTEESVSSFIKVMVAEVGRGC